MSSTDSGAWCRCSIEKDSYSTTSDRRGPGLGEFQLPTGLQIDNHDRIYVVDSFNRRVQVFHYYGVTQAAEGRKEP